MPFLTDLTVLYFKGCDSYKTIFRCRGAKVVTIAQEDGLFDAGDEIVKVNGVDCVELSHDEMLSEIQGSTELALTLLVATEAQQRQEPRGSITVKRPDLRVVSRSDDLHSAAGVWERPSETEPIDVVLSRTSIALSFGFGVGSTDTGHKVVTTVLAGGPASDTLETGDEIIEITANRPASTKYDCAELSHEELVAEIHGATKIRMKLIRESHRKRLVNLGRKGSISTVRPELYVISRDDELTDMSMQSSADRQGEQKLFNADAAIENRDPILPSAPPIKQAQITTTETSYEAAFNDPVVEERPPVLDNRPARPLPPKQPAYGKLTFEIFLGKDKLGLELAGDGPALFIKRILRGHACWRNGKLKPKDRILAINGADATQLSHENAVFALQPENCGETVTITVDRKPRSIKSPMKGTIVSFPGIKGFHHQAQN